MALDIRRGAKLSITVANEKSESGFVRLVSSFESRDSDKVLIITAPALGEILYPLHEGDKAVADYTEVNALYSFDIRILTRFREGDLSFNSVEVCSDIRRTQRRADFRLEISMDGVIEQPDPSLPKPKGHKIHITDISGGGISALANVSIPIKTVTNAYIPIDGIITPYPVEVCRNIRIQNPDSKYAFSLGLKFLFETDKDKDAMVQYVIRLQRDLRKRI